MPNTFLIQIITDKLPFGAWVFVHMISILFAYTS